MPKKKYSKKRPKSRQSWKQLRKKNRLKRKLRLFGLSLLVLFSTFLLLGFMRLWNHLINPRAQAALNFDVPSPISTKKSYAVLIASRSVSSSGDWVLYDPKILIVNKFLKKAVLFSVPPDLEVDTTDFGKISLSGLGRLFQKDTGQNPLSCLEAALKIPVEGVLLSESRTVDFGFHSGGLASLKAFYQLKMAADASAYTNLTFTQLADLFVFVNGLSSADMAQLKWDQNFALSYMERRDFLRESLRLEIVNGSNLEGVALLESEKLTALGIKVSSIRNLGSEDSIPTRGDRGNILLLSRKEYKNLETVKYLSKRYDAEIIYQPDLIYPASLIILNEP